MTHRAGRVTHQTRLLLFPRPYTLVHPFLVAPDLLYTAIARILDLHIGHLGLFGAEQDNARWENFKPFYFAQAQGLLQGWQKGRGDED